MADTTYTYEFTGVYPELFTDLGIVLQPGTADNPTLITVDHPVVYPRLEPQSPDAIAAVAELQAQLDAEQATLAEQQTALAALTAQAAADAAAAAAADPVVDTTPAPADSTTPATDTTTPAAPATAPATDPAPVDTTTPAPISAPAPADPAAPATDPDRYYWEHSVMTVIHATPTSRRWFGWAPETSEGVSAAAPLYFVPFKKGAASIKDVSKPITDGTDQADMGVDHGFTNSTGYSEVSLQAPVQTDTYMFSAVGVLGAGVAAAGANTAALLNPAFGTGQTQPQTFTCWVSDGSTVRKATGVRVEQLTTNYAGADKLVEYTTKGKGQLSVDVTGTSFSPSFTTVPFAIGWKVAAFFCDNFTEYLAGTGFSPVYLESVQTDIKRKTTQVYGLSGQRGPLTNASSSVEVDYKATAIANGQDQTERIAQLAGTKRFLVLVYTDADTGTTLTQVIPQAVHSNADPDGTKDQSMWDISGKGIMTPSGAAVLSSGGSRIYPDPGNASTTTPVAITAGGTQPALSTYFSLGAVPYLQGSAPVLANVNGATAISLVHGVAGTINTLVTGANGGATTSLAVTSGTLPTGLSISGLKITGTPTTPATSTAVVFTATDAATGLTCTFTINITIT